MREEKIEANAYHAHVMAFASKLHERAIVLLIGNIKKLIESKSVLAAHGNVWLDVV